MDLEIAILATRDDDAAGLIKVMDESGKAHLLSIPGCHAVTVLPGVENPGNVLFMVEWESVDVHNASRDTEGFRKFVEVATPFFGAGGSMQHFKLS